jgi:hypothetical protein
MADPIRSRFMDSTAAREDGDVGDSAISTLVAEVALKRALPNHFAADRSPRVGSLTAVRVPSAQWLTPCKQALRSIDGVSVETVQTEKRGVKFDGLEIADATARGAHVIALVTGAVPSTLVTLADEVVEIRRIDLELVRTVIRAVTGQVAKHLDAADIVGLDLVNLVAAVRSGSTAAACVRKLQMLRRNLVTSVDRPEVPVLADLVGYGAAVEWAHAIVADVDRYRAGATVTFETAVFHGPPGTGKTALVNSIAKTARIPLFTTSIASWISRGEGNLGDALCAIDKYVETVAAAAPAVAFIDEIDALPDRARLSARNRDWWLPLINRALLAVESLRRYDPPIVLVAATNRVTDLDPALVRAGRFDRLIEIPPPGIADLAAILDRLLGGEVPEAVLLQIASARRGATGADAQLWVTAAKRRASLEMRPVTAADLRREAIPPDDRPAALRLMTAIHEVGHAVVALALDRPVIRLSILPTAESGGSTEVWQEPIPTKSTVVAQLVIGMAGRAADELFGDGANAGAMHDLANATRCAAWARARWGLYDSLSHKDEGAVDRALSLDPDFARVVEEDLQRALALARAILSDQRNCVPALAEALLERGVLDADEIAEIAGFTTRPIEPPDLPIAVKPHI